MTDRLKAAVEKLEDNLRGYDGGDLDSSAVGVMDPNRLASSQLGRLTVSDLREIVAAYRAWVAVPVVKG